MNRKRISYREFIEQIKVKGNLYMPVIEEKQNVSADCNGKSWRKNPNIRWQNASFKNAGAGYVGSL